MQKILAEIKSGQFAKEWLGEYRAGAKNFKAMRKADHDHGVEQVGRELRKLMSWIDEKEVD